MTHAAKLTASYGIGQSVRRTEDVRLVSGRGRYVGDMSFPGELHAAILQSPYAHARITEIDVSAAKEMDGVVTVLTGADVEADGLGGLPPLFMMRGPEGEIGYRTARPILALEIVRCVGERVAMVVAETRNQALDALDAIIVDYEEFEAVVELDEAVADGAPSVWDGCPGNVSFEIAHGDAAATDEAFASAEIVVETDLRNNRLIANPMEPRAAIGLHDPTDDSYTLYASSQNPHGFREMIARDVLGISGAQLRVISPDVGGGFGAKADCYPEDALVVWAARRTGRPVKWQGTRSDGIAGDYHGRDQVVRAALAADASGRILAVRAHALHALGAYHASAGVAPVLYSLRYIPSIYDIQTVDLRSSAVFTHTTPLGVYRGAGRPEANYVIERLIDDLAAQLGADAAELRLKNMIDPARMPYESATGAIYDSGEFEALARKALDLHGWTGFDDRRADAEARGRRLGRGIGCYIEHAGIYNDRMEIRFEPTGAATILAGTHSHGQGHATVFAQLVSDFLGIPFESIRFTQGDTEKIEIGRGTYAARSSLIGGGALRRAADEIIAKGREMVAWRFGADPEAVAFDHGLFTVRDTNQTMSMVEVAKAYFQPRGLPDTFSVGLSGAGTYSGDVPNYPNGCHVCEVEVDPDTGNVQIVRYTIVDDVGVALNPMIVEGQVQGGLAQGIGQAMMENVAYDRESGQLLSGSFMDYAMPRAEDMGPLKMAHHNVPSPTNPLGLKGCGESGAIGAPPAIMNAILDALRPLGVRHLDMPATPARVWSAIDEAQISQEEGSPT